MNDIKHLCWDAGALGKALEVVGRRAGLAPRAVEAPPPPKGVARGGPDALSKWVVSAAGWLGLEAEPRMLRYPDVEHALAQSAPAIFRVPGEGEPRFLAVIGRKRDRVRVVAPDLSVRTVMLETLRDALCREAERPVVEDINRLLEEIGVPRRRRAGARRGILRQRLGNSWIVECWHLRLSPGAGVLAQAAHARLPRRIVALVGAYVVQYTLWLLSWWVIGRAALDGRLETGWLVAWALLLLTMIPFRLLATWSGALLAVGAGGLLKQRLLHGALRLEPEEIRHEGVGHLLGRVFEGEAVETLAISGGFLGLVALIEIVLAAVVIGAGAGGGLHVLLLAGWVVLALLISWRYYLRRRVWTSARLKITHNLVEVMAGHRTRLAQELKERWHEGEDKSLEDYLGLSSAMDGKAVLLMALVSRGWLVVGLCGVVPAFVRGESTPGALAVSLGGVLLAFRALDKLAESLSSLAGAGIAWQQVGPLFHSAARPESWGVPSFAVTTGRTATPAPENEHANHGAMLLEAHDIAYRYPDRPEPVLRDCRLRVCAGDRLLLEGPSGGGKSTLASLLTGMRLPQSGLILLGGLDRQTLGMDGWRRRVVTAPQFHENHVLTETFVFNLLMGRRWPPRAEDIREAEAVCKELGLGELIARMPAGFEQMVGESGWQLSHGERSRLYIARALLQDADLLVLDESFAALDPENLRRALNCVLRRASTLLVIAHP